MVSRLVEYYKMGREILAEAKGISLKCELCGKKGLLNIHHLDRNLHNNKLINLALLCPSCHMKKHIEYELSMCVCPKCGQKHVQKKSEAKNETKKVG